MLRFQHLYQTMKYIAENDSKIECHAYSEEKII